MTYCLYAFLACGWSSEDFHQIKDFSVCVCVVCTLCANVDSSHGHLFSKLYPYYAKKNTSEWKRAKRSKHRNCSILSCKDLARNEGQSNGCISTPCKSRTQVKTQGQHLCLEVFALMRPRRQHNRLRQRPLAYTAYTIVASVALPKVVLALNPDSP